MDKIQDTSRTASDLRTEAERRSAARLSLLNNPVDESALPKMLFEISLREVEFETQNAALRQSRDENEEARRRYMDLFEFAPLGYLMLDEDGDIIEGNITGAAMLGVPRDRLHQSTFLRFVEAKDLEQFEAYRRAVLESSAERETFIPLKRSDDSLFPARLSCVRMPCRKSGRLTWIRMLIHDRSRFVEAEEALKASEARYRELLENIPDIVWSMDARGRFTFISPQARALLGFEPEEILRFGIGEWRVRMHPEDRDRVWQASQALLEEGREYTEEFRFLHKDNYWIWVQAHARISRFGGNDFRIDGLLMDITREREMQEQLSRFSEDLARQLKEQREQVERLERRRSAMDKLAATGRVAAAIAHEINNPLSGIRSSFQLIRGAIPENHPNFSYVPLIEKELARVTDIIRQMYLLYQPSEHRVQACDPAVAAREVVQILSSTFSARGVEVKLQIDPETCKANINEGELKQVIYNILHNALRFSPEGGSVTLTMSQHAEQPLLSITDQGPGIAPEILPHIFEPFFTGRSKEERGENMGLGLSVSWSLISNVGGWIEVESEPGKGTTFKIFLPVT